MKAWLYFLLFTSLTASAVQEPTFAAVRPILEQSCLECHDDKTTKGGLNLSTREQILEGGDSADAVSFDKAEASEILRRVLLPQDDDEFMPPSSKKKHRTPLKKEEIQALRAWIQAQSPWPEGVVLAPRQPTTKTTEILALSTHPAEIKLEGSRDFHRLIVLAHQADATTVDVTSEAQITLADSSLAKIEGTTLKPLKDGQTTIKVRFQQDELSLPLTIIGASNRREISFLQDVLPVLTAAGCNTGSCHGSARGQDGFMLSLFGYDPDGDYHRITRELSGRRINLSIPENSLLLTKATGEVPHTGGKIFGKDHPFYDSLREWIAMGAKDDPTDLPQPIRIEVEPKEFVLEGSHQKLPLTVKAHYSDGTDRDVTQLSTFTTSNSAAIQIDDETGIATSQKRGEAFLLARFHTFTEGSQGIVIPENLNYQRPDFPSFNEIDKHISEKLHKLRLIPAPRASDEVLVRRAYLDIIGKLPTVEERNRFLNDSAPNRFGRLVDELIERPEFTNLWVMKWAELIQVRSTGRAANTITPKAARLWHDWLAEQFHARRPFNEIIRDLLSAQGGTLDTPQTNYYKLEKDPRIIMENAAQVFMGTRLQCAQCHNHPFDRWTMDDYYGFAAFFSEIKRKGGQDPAEQIIFDGRGEIQHPITKAKVPPRFLGGDQAKVATQERRSTLANWLTEPDNPWFARNVANIVWSHFFGVGIVDPVDDIRVSNPATNPQLLDHLERTLAASHFDFRDLVRHICKSRTYQLSSRVNETNAEDLTNFSHANIRRLRAEVLIDIIAQATGTKTKFTGLEQGASATLIPDGTTTNYFLKTFGRATRKTVCSCEVKMEPNLSQALHLLNGEATHKRIRDGRIVQDLLTKQKKSPTEIIEHLYLRTLQRQPTEKEKSHLLNYLPVDAQPALQQEVLNDIFWALLNSKEFLFNH